MATFPTLTQRNQMDCGPSCLYIVCKFYKQTISIEMLRELTEIGKEGVSLLGISDAAEKIGFKTLPVQCSLSELSNDIKLPAILHEVLLFFYKLHFFQKSLQYAFCGGGGEFKKIFFIIIKYQ
ncbi:MAG TPA: cysteine peptidase family C39 domain-containing protein [Ferruginibacter sp.]|nr:cysteine peptidase family C39 domain-containing protein [Ferruginibacter sp.]